MLGVSTHDDDFFQRVSSVLSTVSDTIVQASYSRRPWNEVAIALSELDPAFPGGTEREWLVDPRVAR